MLKKNHSLQKNHSFLFRELQLITILLLIRNPCTSWSTRFISLEPCVGFSIFDSAWFLLKFIFLFNKKDGLFYLKRHNSFQNKNNRRATHGFAPRLLIFKLQHEVWKFFHIRVSWSSPKSDRETNFLNLENRTWGMSLFLNSNF